MEKTHYMQIYLFRFMPFNKMQVLYKLLLWLLVFIVMPCCAEQKDLEATEPFGIPAPRKAMDSIFIHLRHAEIEQVVKALDKKQAGEGLLSKEGKVVADKAANAIWVSDFSDRLAIIRDLIKKMDQPVKQVILQAYIVNADQNFTRDIGVDFSGGPASLENSGQGTQNASRFSLNKNKLNITMAKLGPEFSLEMALTALENQGRGRILSSPRLMTSNGKAAYIGSGDEIPYQERTAHGNTNVAFKKAVLSLEVTPQLLPENTIVLDLVVHQDKVSALLVNGVPAIHTQEVRTQVRVSDKQTIVLGGIFEYVQSEQFTGVPVLGNLPVIGGLFRHKINKRERRELLIFITPRIALLK